jgi:hypothetical protein
MPCVKAKTRTRIAPVHGLMPIENTTTSYSCGKNTKCTRRCDATPPSRNTAS